MTILEEKTTSQKSSSTTNRKQNTVSEDANRNQIEKGGLIASEINGTEIKSNSYKSYVNQAIDDAIKKFDEVLKVKMANQEKMVCLALKEIWDTLDNQVVTEEMASKAQPEKGV